MLPMSISDDLDAQADEPLNNQELNAEEQIRDDRDMLEGDMKE